MFFSEDVGLFVCNEEDRALLTHAIRECGLHPVILIENRDPATPNLDFAAVAPDPDEEVASGAHRLRLIVTDDQSAIDRQIQQECATCWGQHASLILLVAQALPDVSSAADSGRRQDIPSAADSHPWILSRPLHIETVKSELRKAVHASRIFAERNRTMNDELRRARVVLESMSNGVTITDATLPDHPLIYVNPAFERMTGYSFSECQGRNSRFLQGTDIRQPDLPKIRQALLQSCGARALLRNYRKDGTPFWNELYMSPLFDSESRLTHFIGFQNDVTERVDSAMLIEHLANHDSLTGLANRALMMEQLKQALARARRGGSSVAVLFFDLNNFKYVNDEFGHEAGDHLLRAVAKKLQRDTRSSEVVARIGGDEFVAILEDIATAFQARDIMERLSAAISEPYMLSDEEFYPSASVGLAIFPRDGQTPEALLKAADAEMYREKQTFHRGEELVTAHLDSSR